LSIVTLAVGSVEQNMGFQEVSRLDSILAMKKREQVLCGSKDGPIFARMLCYSSGTGLSGE
jgi:purine nucleoside phosphorylase